MKKYYVLNLLFLSAQFSAALLVYALTSKPPLVLAALVFAPVLMFFCYMRPTVDKTEVMMLVAAMLAGFGVFDLFSGLASAWTWFATALGLCCFATIRAKFAGAEEPFGEILIGTLPILFLLRIGRGLRTAEEGVDGLPDH